MTGPGAPPENGGGPGLQPRTSQTTTTATRSMATLVEATDINRWWSSAGTAGGSAVSAVTTDRGRRGAHAAVGAGTTCGCPPFAQPIEVAR